MKRLSNNMQNELIRDVCSSLMSYTIRPSKSERIHVAFMLIKNYPFIADKSVLEGSTAWVCTNLCTVLTFKHYGVVY